MPRTARIVLPNYPHHIIQRGHNRQTVFAAPRDYERYLDNLREWKTAFGCRVYAYCLMTNHVHLIVDPGENPGSLARLMKRLGIPGTPYLISSKKIRGEEKVSARKIWDRFIFLTATLNSPTDKS